MKNPLIASLKTPEAWQAMVGLAEGALALDAARIHGLVEGGPDINADWFAEVLYESAKRGFHPSENAIETFVYHWHTEFIQPKQPSKAKPIEALKKNREEIFFQWCRLFQNFVAREGHGFVPFRHLEDGLRLGLWVVNQQTKFKKGTLSHARINRLEQLVDWQWHAQKKFSQFLKRFGLLKAFFEEHGHLKIPGDYQPEGIQLAHWLCVLRWKHRQGKLGAEKVSLLNQVPGWDQGRGPIKRLSLHVWVQLLRQFIAREGHALVPVHHQKDGEPLGRWAKAQPPNRVAGKISKARIKTLSDIPEWRWEDRKKLTMFHGWLKLHGQFVQKYGHGQNRGKPKRLQYF